MNEPEPVDLSVLDPARPPERWAAIVEATRFRVAAALEAREADPLALLVAWHRRVLAAAAAVLVLLGAAAAAWSGHRPAESEARRLAHLAESAVLHGRAPAGAQVWAAIEGSGPPR
jgi:hypothetical protein